MKARRVSHSSAALSEAASLFSNENESFNDNSMSPSASSGEKKKKKKKDKDKKEKKTKKMSSPKESSSDFGDDLFFSARNSDEPANWAPFDQPDKVWKTEDDGWHNQVSQNTQITEAMTTSTFGSDDLPFSTIEVDHAQGNQPSFGMVPDLEDSAAVAQFHSEMLQGFLKRNGHEATMAVATAAAFENFLKQQQDVMVQLTTGGDAYDRDFDEEDRLDIMESIADEDVCGDSFAPDSIWDEGSFMNEKAMMMAEYMRPGPRTKNSLSAYANRNSTKPSAYASSVPRRKKDVTEDKFDEKAVMMAEFMKQGERQEEHQFDEKARMMADYMNESSADYDDSEREELAAYHGEMLQGFLQRHGEQDDTALQTASAFQDFLKRQQDALAKLSAPPSSDVSKGSAFSRGAWSENEANGFHEETGVPAFIGQPRHLDHAASVLSFHSEGSGGLKTRNLIAKHQASQSARSDGNYKAPPGTVNLKSPPESGVKPERSVQQQVEDLTVSQLECFQLMRKQAKGSFTDWWCLRFARCADFKPKQAQKVMKKFDRRFLDLNIGGMKTALRSKLLYPLPGVLGRGGLKMFYMKFQRLNPRKITMTEFANHLVYVMNCIHETEASCVQGIGLISDMSEFSMSNFSIPLINKFLMLVQGRQVPVKVESLIFVNAPKWFGTLWGVMKQMMSTDFLKTKVHRVTFHELMRNHLPRGCETFLTNDMFVGRRPADDIVEEFITQREQIESQRILGRSDG